MKLSSIFSYFNEKENEIYNVNKNIGFLVKLVQKVKFEWKKDRHRRETFFGSRVKDHFHFLQVPQTQTICFTCP